ncbi:MAG TPA: heme exporter protein CcmD [Steroidobacteraceae bacterium]|nr:heme exporter protein CcmD [Steroidobacteraceae bacterium]
MADFFRMSGYAFYVWGAYALAVGALLLNVWWARRSHARAIAEARRRLARSVVP